jgi:hypothetical protein
MVTPDGFSTIRVKNSTKSLLTDLDIAKKNVSFENIILELIKHYKKG